MSMMTEGVTSATSPVYPMISVGALFNNLPKFNGTNGLLQYWQERVEI